MMQTSDVTRLYRLPERALLPRAHSASAVSLDPAVVSGSLSLSIGRSAECEVWVDDPEVESRHAELYAVGELWWVRDCGSQSGTYLDGELVEASPVCDGAVLRVGSSRIEVRVRSVSGA